MSSTGPGQALEGGGTEAKQQRVRQGAWLWYDDGRLWLKDTAVRMALDQGTGTRAQVGAAALMVVGSGDGGAVAQAARARQRELRWLGRGKR